MKDVLSCRVRTCAALLLAGGCALAGLIFLAEAFYRHRLASAEAGAGGEVFDLYGIGESSMEGAPYYKSPPSIVYLLFAGKLAGRPLRVRNLAFGGNSVYPQAIKLIRTLKYRDKANPGVLLIYAGHNERMRPRSPWLPERLFEAFRKRVLIRSLLLSEGVLRLERLAGYTGVRDGVHYEFYLSAAIKAALEAGVVPVISTLGSNMSAAEPYGVKNSIPGIEAGLELELAGEYQAAAAYYSRLLEKAVAEGETADSLSYLEYRLGRCFQALKRPAFARKHLLAALESDPVQFRAKPSQNEIIRKLALKYRIPLLDAEKLFEAHSADGLPGKDLFIDLMHPNARGYLLLARAFAGLLEKQCRDKVRDDIRDPDFIFASPQKRRSSSAFPFVIADRGGPGKRPSYPDPKYDAESTPYLQAGIFLLWFSDSSFPIPDRLALAGTNFMEAQRLGANNLVAVGLRIVNLSRKNRNTIPAEVNSWFRKQRPYFEYLDPLSDEKMREADAFLSKWESSASGAGSALLP